MIGSKLQERYELVEELGRGGMGIVYRAWDPVLNREVAVKMIPPLLLNRETEERFQREARLVAGMDHPSIVPIHDFGHHEGSLFFVMPWVQGTLLQELVQDGSLLLDEILDVGAQVAEALDYSHSRGVIHRDIKPGNIMISRDARGLRIRVMDFGLARGDTERRLTKTGGLVGTLTNLSPEQISSGHADPRSDIYALGTVLYECLCGHPPFSGAVHSALYRIAHEPPRTLSELGFDYSETLEQLVLRCLAKDPAERPQRGSELAAALGEIRSSLDDTERLRTVGTRTRPLAVRPTEPIPSPLVGRQGEWAELQSRLSAALAGECQFVVVEGDAGTGKSRLLIELENLARARRIRVLRGRFVDHESAIPYQGLCELIQGYFRQHEIVSSSASASQHVTPPSADFSDLASDLITFFPVLSEIGHLRVGAGAEGDETGRPAFGAAAARRLLEHESADPTRLYELLARALARIGGGKPLVLLIENLHEGEVSLAALSYITRRLGPTPTLILGTCRRAEADPGHPLHRMLKGFVDDPRFASIGLGPLGLEDFRRLVELQLGSAEIGDDLLRRLYEATEGNPYFGQELVRWLLESGGLARGESGRWSLVGGAGFAAEALPATIQQAVERRIERLDPMLRSLLSLASILGKTFTYQELEHLVALADSEIDDLDEAIDRLLTEGVFEEDVKSRDDRLHFSRGVMRDLLYHELSRRKRRSLHRRYAFDLEKRYSGRHERVYPRLVHHFSAGDVAEKTVEYALELARESLATYSPDDAIRAARAALDFIDDDIPARTEGELLEILAASYRAAGSTGKALSEAERAVDAFTRAEDPARAAEAALLAAETAWQARRVDAARPWVDRGLELAQSAGTTDVLRRLLTLGATVANLRGEHQEARRHLERAEELAPARLNGDEAPPPSGGTLHTALPYPISTVDPVEITTDEEFEVAANTFETLLSADADGNLVGSLCANWKSSDDGRIFELTLCEDICFSDGWPLKANDVKNAIERSRRQLPGLAAIRDLEVLEAPPDDGEVSPPLGSPRGEVSPPLGSPRGDTGGERLRFHLDEPLPIFPALLTDPSSAIYRVIEAEGRKRLLGTGPFRLVSVSDEKVVLERNPRFWRGTPPPLDRIEFSSSLDASGIAEALRAGTLDIGRDLLPADLESIQRDPRFRNALVESTKKNVYFLLFNQAGPVACQRQVRRALLGTVRVQDLVWRTLGRFAQPAVSFLPPGVLGHDPGRRPFAVGRQRAVQWLERAAEIQRPIRLEAAIHPLFQDRYEALARTLLRDWAALGIEVVNRSPTMEEYLSYWSGKADVDLLIGRWNADIDDPDNFTHGLFHSRAGRLAHLYSTPEADHLLERARQESQSSRRQSLYRRFEELLVEDHILLPLFHDVDYRIAGPHVRRLHLEASPPYVDYARVAKLREAPEAPPRQRLAAGGEIHVPLPVRSPNLDPTAGNVGETFEAKICVFETLTRVAEGARVVPWLGAFFEAPGGRSYHFRLRDKVRFHDGRRLTARDVRYTFERFLKEPDTKLHFLLLPILGARQLRDGHAKDLEGFRIVSAEEFVVELVEPLAFFPAHLTHPSLGIVPEGCESFAASWRDGCAGTGAFRVLRFDPEEGVDLEKNPDYWRPELPRVQRLFFHFGCDSGRALADFRSGRLSMTGGLRPADVEALRQDPDFAVGYHEAPRLSTAFLAFNTANGPFADAALRHGLCAALDVESAVRETVDKGVIRAYGVLPPGLLGHEPRRLPGSSARFEAGELQTVEIRAALHPAFVSQYSSLWDHLLRTMRELGLTVKVVDDPLMEYLRGSQRGHVHLMAGRWIADYPDADAFVVGLLHSKEGVLAGLCHADGIDERITAARRETDPSLRHAIYRELEELIARERLLVPLFHEQNYRFMQPSVQGLKLGLTVPEVRYEELYIAR